MAVKRCFDGGVVIRPNLIAVVLTRFGARRLPARNATAHKKHDPTKEGRYRYISAGEAAK